jgi:DNA-directed RNA polymerase I subunit RPA49
VVVPTEGDRAKMKISKAEAVNHNIAKLKLPLNFPKVKMAMNKKRGR